MMEALRAALDGFEVEYFESIASTNAYLKSVADEHGEGHIVVAHEQSAGRGRLGRSFFSPAGTGVYMSVLLKPKLDAKQCTDITAAAAVAASEAIDEACGKKSDIKWVNDIYIEGKKVCGILTEAVFDADRMKCAVLGIGINVREPVGGFPEEIKNIAGSVFESADDKTVASLVSGFLRRFFVYYDRLEKIEYLDKYREKLLYVGERINVISPTETYAATLVSVNDDFSLNVRTDDGEKRVFSGEISIRKN